MELLRIQELPGEHVALSATLGVSKQWWDGAAWHERAEARALAIGRSMRRAVLLGAAAARIQRLWVFRPRSGAEVIRLGLPSGSIPTRAATPPGCSFSRVRSLAYENLRGVRVTARARTVIDVARYDGWIRGFAAAESFLRNGGQKAELEDELLRVGRMKGVAEARRAIALAGGLSESPYEALAYALLVFAGVKVRQQVCVEPDIRVDLLVDGRVVVEIDGAVKYDGSTYGRDPYEVVVAERRREVRIQNLGYAVVRFMASEIERDPEGFIDAVRGRVAAVVA